MPKIFNKKYFIITAIGIFLISGILIANVISNLLYTPASTQNANKINATSFEIHFLSLNKSQIENSAKALAPDYQKIGAGGYIWEVDGYYHIFSSGFENKNDAILVQNNLSANNITSEIITIKFDNFDMLGNFENEHKKVLTKAINSFQSTYQSLYDIAISLDTSVYNEISARLAINSVHSSVSTINADYTTLFSQTTSTSLSTLASYLEKEEDITQQLCTGKLINSNQTYSSLIKYRYIQLLDTYQDLTKQINAKIK